jgi:polysaccharide pyruvyl transferase WcaK-like protein
MGRPLVSLGYAPKNDALMADVGLETFCEDVDTVAFERLVEQFEKLVAGRESYAAIVDERVGAMSARLTQALRDLDLMPVERR